MVKYTKEFLIGIYRMMLKIRLCEENAVEPIISGEINCPVHLYSGQEAVACGVCASLTDKDYIFSSHRSHGHYLAKGGDLRGLVAEIYCKESGCSKGRGGSMHLCDPQRGFLGSVPIVGGSISLALGCALAAKIRNKKYVTVSFFGDGAAGEGVLYESLNFAALKKLPMLFICENNLYATHMPIRECRPNNHIYKIAMPFGIKAFRVDGNDVLKVYEAAKKSVQLCKRGRGPVFIEFLTYRLRGHVGPDDNIQGIHTNIRPRREVDFWKKKDPIVRLEYFLKENKILKDKDFIKIKLDIENEVKQAYKLAKKSSFPKTGGLTKYVFR